MNTFVIFSRATSHLAFTFLNNYRDIPRVLYAQFYTWDSVSCIVIPTSSCVHLSALNLLLIRPNPIKNMNTYPSRVFSFKETTLPNLCSQCCICSLQFSHLLLSPLCRWAHLQHLVLLFASNHFRARQCVLSFHPITYHDSHLKWTQPRHLF